MVVNLRVIFYGVYHNFKLNIILKCIVLKTNHINKCPPLIKN